MDDLIIPEQKLPQLKSEEYSCDLDYARKNTLDLIEQGQKGLENMISIADQSQHPRAYEVLSNYLRTLSDLNKNLLEISEKKSEQKEEAMETAKVINQNVFVGSTAELLEFIKSAKNSKANE